MNTRTHAVVGEIENVLVRDMPSYSRLTATYEGSNLVLTVSPQPTIRGALHEPTQSQSPGVDIDAVHRKYQGGKKP